MDKNKFVGKQRQRRRFRIRKKVRGDLQRPRLCIVRTHKHIGCQVIDDETRKTLVSASTRDKDLSASISYGGNKAAAEASDLRERNATLTSSDAEARARADELERENLQLMPAPAGRSGSPAP